MMAPIKCKKQNVVLLSSQSKMQVLHRNATDVQVHQDSFNILIDEHTAGKHIFVKKFKNLLIASYIS
jgi:hypothetical protein